MYYVTGETNNLNYPVEYVSQQVNSQLKKAEKMVKCKNLGSFDKG